MSSVKHTYRRAIIIPTYNEAENLKALVPRIKSILPDADIIVVDDNSPDGTAEVAWNLGCKCTKRLRSRGLASAVIDGLLSVDYHGQVVIMDADQQHDPGILPELFRQLDTKDLVIASRYCPSGSINGWGIQRKVISLMANLLALPLVPKIKDRTTGYFGFNKRIIQGVKLNRDIGYKIGLEIFCKTTYGSFAEIPYTFQPRKLGSSKFNRKQAWLYLKHLFQLYLGSRLVKFALVGTTGAIVKLGLTYSLTEFTGLFYMVSYAVGFTLSVANNYLWNSLWTFKEKESNLSGLGRYAGISLLTLVINEGLILLLTGYLGLWYMLSASVGLLTAFLFNFILSRKIVWTKKG